MKLEEAILHVNPICDESYKLAKKHWDSIAKPLNSLGSLELIVNQLAGILKTPEIDISKRCVVIMCADNGVVAQGVTQSDSIVTSILAENFVKQTTTVCTMAKYINMNIIPVDIGINRNLTIEGLTVKKVMYGTNDMTQGPAMTREQAIKGIEVGINIALQLKEQGYKCIATGEMGIGNTTSSSAVTAVLFDKSVELVTGRGAGLDGEGLDRKINAIKKAIEVNKPNKDDAIDVLSKVGGLDIAGIVGLYIGGAVAGIPVLIDGFISGVSAVIASRICPMCKEYMVASHVSAELAGYIVLDELEFSPIVTAGMCLGEGTGAVAALSIIDMAIEVYNKSIKFSQINMEGYVHLT